MLESVISSVRVLESHVLPGLFHDELEENMMREEEDEVDELSAAKRRHREIMCNADDAEKAAANARRFEAELRRKVQMVI